MSLSVFITGGSTGIGLEMAKVYLQKGYKVGVCGRTATKFSVFEGMENISCYEVDVSDRENLIGAIEKFNTEFGLDIIVANAGLSFEHKTQIPNFEMSRKIIDVNLVGALNTFEAAIPIMLKNGGGQLVGIASIAAMCGFPGVSAYSASKAALSVLLEGYQVDLASKGISTTCIYPGFVDTPLTQKNHHKMPFMLNADVAAKKIVRAIEKKKMRYGLPWHFVSLIKLVSILPRSVFLLLMRIYNFDYYPSKH